MIRDYDCSLKKSQYVISGVVQRSLTTKVQSDKQQEFTVKVNDAKKTIVLVDGSDAFEYPFVWLRDNCQCSECFHETSLSRIINWEKFDLSVSPKNVEINESKKTVSVTWSDKDHQSEYSFQWLKERNFTQSNREQYLKKFYRPTKNLWSKKDFSKIIKSFDFQKIIDSDDELRDWLEALTVNGIAFIKNTPETEEEARRIVNRVGFIKKTHYGEEFIVKAKPGTSNVAFLSAPLQLHTDLPYYEYKPGTNFLHCLVQSKSIGAKNTIVDGFYVADYMKQNYPNYYKILSSVLVNWSDVGQEEGNKFHSIYRAPMFSLDYEGNLERINHSIPQRDSFFTIPFEDITTWYEALAKFVELIHQESVEFKTEEGTILTFDNIRLIHGRTVYTDTSDNYRYIVGAYLDWDEIYSKLRVLQKLN
ncbi:unnamed protein product [Diamesa hyperborea]